MDRLNNGGGQRIADRDDNRGDKEISFEKFIYRKILVDYRYASIGGRGEKEKKRGEKRTQRGFP